MKALRFILAAGAVLVGFALLSPLLVLGVPLMVVSLGTRVVRRCIDPKAVSWKKIIEYSPEFGWRPKANLNTFAMADKAFHLTTDSDGWRGKSGLAEAQVVVFGDSFAFGYGVNDEAFYGDLIPNVRIKAIGVNGYNMVQAFLWMERLAAKLTNKLVVWFIYYGNDLYENLQPNLDQYRMPFVREIKGTEQWEIVHNHISPKEWSVMSKRNYYDRLAEICCPTYLSHRVFSACNFLIFRGKELCDRAGARLVVMSVPDTTQFSQSQIEFLASRSPNREDFNPDLPDREIQKICQKFSIPFVSLKNHLTIENHKEFDCHWNETGHQRVSDVLQNLYREHLEMSKLSAVR